MVEGRTRNIGFVHRLSPPSHEPCTKSILHIIWFFFFFKVELVIVTWEGKDSSSKGKEVEGSLVKGSFVSTVGVWDGWHRGMLPRVKEQRARKRRSMIRLKREKVHDKGAGARANLRLGKALFITLCSYFALVGPQTGSSGVGLHACTVLPLCWVIPPTYKAHKIMKNECKCQENCPCSSQPKKELVYVTYERAVTHFFSDGVIPLGSSLLASIKHIFL